MKKLVLGIGIFLGIFSCTKKIDYSAQVKPILNKHCLSCHGGVQKQGGFSLLFQEEALAKAESGLYPIIPRNASKSELIKRINHHDPELRMPYEKDPLSKKEIQILTKWINQGAEWSDHWAYVPLKKPSSPNGIDFYIQKTARNNGLDLMSQADDITLRRRIALDVIGMPTLFSSSLPIPQYIDSLLKLPEFGEKWTSMWLDLARYADTKGYERDDSRDIWRYRDWVIEAFNQDMPYDSFLILQIAGDLIPNPSDQDYLATAFHRNTMTNDEGGTENEEYRVAAVIDRVNTTWEVMMGTTFSCVQCHSHPYDPFKHEDYYKFMAYFNNTRDEDTYHDYPVLRHFSDSTLQKLEHFQKNLDNWTPDQSKATIHFIKTLQPSINSIQTHSFVNAELSDTKFLGMRNKSAAILPNVDLTNHNVLVFQARARVKNSRLIIKAGEIIADISINVKPEAFWQWKNYRVPLQNISGVHDLELIYTSPELNDLNTEGIYFNWFHFTRDWEVKNRKHRVALDEQFMELLNEKTPATPILLENTGQQYRKTHVFERGAWTSHLEEVKPGIPEIFFKNKIPQSEGNRLDLAKWMTSKENPLVARTIVNRIWEQLFGIGLVETLEDLGSQGIPSPHIALLDELSYRFMTEMKWSIKTLIKEILISATYQQDSRVSNQHQRIDPTNKLFARGPRLRLTGEQIRDQALLISGLLSKKMFGPPVMPYQPEGIWNAPYNGAKWKLSEGEDRYRRAVYTYWKRSSPYPALTNFDGAQREVCVSRRIRTNTPIQALVTMNDSAYVEMSYHFAKMALEKENSIEFAYERATGKKLDEKKLKILGELYLEVLEEFECDPTLKPELEAMAIVCNTILNLDEVLNKT
jgi:hypothetical protein